MTYKCFCFEVKFSHSCLTQDKSNRRKNITKSQKVLYFSKGRVESNENWSLSDIYSRTSEVYVESAVN